jgi:hypothetical protein
MTTKTANCSEASEEARMSRISERLRRENLQLRQEVAKLGALVDHYFGAYSEAKSLVTRRERELADVRRELASAPVGLKRRRQ